MKSIATEISHKFFWESKDAIEYPLFPFLVRHDQKLRIMHDLVILIKSMEPAVCSRRLQWNE
jgi:hypothetical protein